MRVVYQVGEIFLTSGLALGLAWGCAASETENTGVPEGAGGVTAPSASGGTTSNSNGGIGGRATTNVGGTSTARGGSGNGGNANRGGNGASGATVTPRNCTVGAVCMATSCTNTRGVICPCRNGVVTACK